MAYTYIHMQRRTILLRLCLVLSLAGMITAGATLATIVQQYCAREEECEDGLTTLSSMSREDPQRSLLANGLTSSVVLLVFGDEAVHLVLQPRLSEALRCLNSALAALTVILSIVGIVSVRADPASKLHLNAGIAWLGLRIVYLIALTSLAFPEAHRAGSACEECERLGAYSRVVTVLVVAALGVVMGVQAPSGALSGRTQIAATLAVATYNVCCWETVLLDAPAPGASVVGTQRV